MNSLMEIHIFVNDCFSLIAGVRFKRGVDTYVWHFYNLLWNFDTSLLLFLKGHVDVPVNYNAFERSW